MNKLQQHYNGSLPELVMFDLDGTLIDSAADIAIAVNKTLASLNLPVVDESDVRKWVGNGAEVLIRRALTQGDDQQTVDENLLAQAIEKLLVVYPYHHDAKHIYNGVVDFLDALKAQQVPMAIVTNKPVQFVAPLLEELNLDGYFSWIGGGGSLPQKKPAPEPLLHVLQQAGVTADRALFVGDSRNDVLAAKAASVPCAALTYGYNHGQPIAEEEPTWVIDNLLELL